MGFEKGARLSNWHPAANHTFARSLCITDPQYSRFADPTVRKEGRFCSLIIITTLRKYEFDGIETILRSLRPRSSIADSAITKNGAIRTRLCARQHREILRMAR